ncbi:hypothetical protein DFP92_1109 [Yoonia sediminilitoris]|uniref:DDE family transposase n=1 Tax=Yoonia sediminilitoris TaxID=1286148 RepID=A0A2T6KBT2_9RHOB|nr:hypothetical protein C8N45_1109 [Yoonia sediminilitoris]RCW93064.1 hypothetical protein DFP92_1109 [Yoonia sediminilitoris]
MDRVPDHSTFSKNRHGRFRESDLLRHVFETTLARCMKEGLVGGQGFAVDASLICAVVQKQNSSNPKDWAAREIDPNDAPRAVREYLNTLDDESFGAATTAMPKFTVHADPASQRTAARKGPAFFAYSDNYLIDTEHGIIMDVDASRSNKTAEVGAMRMMLDRTEDRFGVKPDWIAADIAYGSSDNLVWLALKRQILPFTGSTKGRLVRCAAIHAISPGSASTSTRAGSHSSFGAESCLSRPQSGWHQRPITKRALTFPNADETVRS